MLQMHNGHTPIAVYQLSMGGAVVRGNDWMRVLASDLLVLLDVAGIGTQGLPTASRHLLSYR